MVRKKYTAAWTVLTHRDVCYQPKRLSMTKTVITIRQQEDKKRKKSCSISLTNMARMV